MLYLFIVTLIWAFSFSLIKDQLISLDSNFVAFARMGISFLVFLPFMRLKKLSSSFTLKLIITGAIQYGVMYSAYIYSFQFLQAYQVALFTIFTPLYVSLANDLLTRRFHPIFLITALATIAGTGIIVYNEFHLTPLLTGFYLIQISNLAFAAGQVYYKKLLGEAPELKDVRIFTLLYLGAFVTTGLFSAFTTPWADFSISQNQALTLLYLGAVASGLGFFLWNVGVRKVNTGTLAVFNNLKIPLAIFVALLFFEEQADIPRLLAGSLIIIGALFFNKYHQSRNKHKQ